MPISEVKLQQEFDPRGLIAVMGSNRKRAFRSYCITPNSPCADFHRHCRVSCRIRVEFTEITDESNQLVEYRNGFGASINLVGVTSLFGSHPVRRFAPL